MKNRILFVLLGLVTAALAACAPATPTSAPEAEAPEAEAPEAEAPEAEAPEAEAPEAEVPEVEIPKSVDKLTVAVDGWGTDDLCPVQMSGDNFLQDYFNPLLVHRDENYNIVPYLAVDWDISDEGISFTLHPDATWEDGSPITAEDVKWNLEAQAGMFEEFTGTTDASQLADAIEDIEVLGEKELFIRTVAPNAFLFSLISGSGYHSHHMGNPRYIQEVGCPAYNENPSGAGPYTVTEWHPGERIVLERREDFWGDSPALSAPQHQTLEIILNADSASRFALLQSGQADVVVNIPYALAAELPLSDDFEGRGINPGLGGNWIQLIEGAGNMSITMPNLFAIQDSPNKPTEEELKPFDDIRVREAMELAIDKVAISRDALFGFTKPMNGIWFSGGVGYRPEQEVSPYDPVRAQELLAEAGYADGFSADLYYGPFPNTPGLQEWLEAAASYWQAVGIEVSLHEIVAEEFYQAFGLAQGFGERERAWRPLAVQTWGRFEETANIANFGYNSDGIYACCYDEVTDELVAEIIVTADPDERAALLIELEDHILENRWLIPMDEKAIVVGYSDNVASHMTAPFASSWESMWRVVLKD